MALARNFDATVTMNDDDEEKALQKQESVESLRRQLVDVQRKLLNAFGHRIAPSDKDAGHVVVDFVQTRLKKRNKLLRFLCRNKQTNVKVILHKLRADFPEGCVTALMGPSGAGKTTLLDFLTGTLGDAVQASGSVALPDDDAYVPQDDRLHGFYTCQAYMKHYARLKGIQPLMGMMMDCCSSSSSNSDLDHLPRGSNDVDTLIADILSEVGLTAQRNTVVGGMFQRGLSGGQKRRLSVALEAVSSPLNLFLDEPTSGLDSESALALVNYLHNYARGKDPKTGRLRRVILTIHQPSSQIWESIDNVVLMAEGRLMYQGPRREMSDFFAAFGHPVPLNYNTADHAIEVLSKMPELPDGSAPPADASKAQLWNKCFEKWDNLNKTQQKQASDASVFRRRAMLQRDKSCVFRKGVDFDDNSTLVQRKLQLEAKKSFRTTIELTRRSFTSLFLNPVVLGFRIAVYTAMALGIGILFFQMDKSEDLYAEVISRAGLLYFIIGFLPTMSLAQIPFAILDRGISQKEIRNHLFHPAINHTSQALTSVLVCFILALISSAVVLPMTGLQPPYYEFATILFLSFVCGDAMSMLISHISPELISAICISSGIVGLFVMSMGFLVLQNDLPQVLRWLYYVPYLTYGFRSLMYNEFHDLQIVFNASDVQGLPVGILGEISNYTSGSIQSSVGYCIGDKCFMPEGGNQVLKAFHMEDVNVIWDMIALVIWACSAHAVSIIFLSLTHIKNKRMFVYSDQK